MASLPDNLAAKVPKETLQWIFNKYVWPQMQERKAFEPLWDELNQMYRIKTPDSFTEYRNRNKIDEEDSPKGGQDEKVLRVSDSIIFDTVDRLKNLGHFISWKNGRPVKFDKPKFYSAALEDAFYNPTTRKLEAANAGLDWDIANHGMQQKDLAAWQHRLLYGIEFVLSNFEFRIEAKEIRQENGKPPIPQFVVTKLGTTFDPISIRKVWLNWRIPASEMSSQPCPFHFEPTPRFKILGNIYDAKTNPFGYLNLDKISKTQCDWHFSQEKESWIKGLQESLNSLNDSGGTGTGTGDLVDPKYSVEAKWTFYPMLPLNPALEIDEEMPWKRYIVEVFGQSLTNGEIVAIRFSELPYSNDLLPLYASSHIPDLDSGLYTPSIGEMLRNHFKEIVLAKNQWLDNKDWVNNPPYWYLAGSGVGNKDINKPGAGIECQTPNDFGWRIPFDATGTTSTFLAASRESAQTTGKAVDALLGKAAGGRTSATEASNMYETAMSGITTDINHRASTIYAGYAKRSWANMGQFLDLDLLNKITGENGISPLTLSDLWIEIGIVTTTGSQYIESVLKQQHIRYAIEASVNSPALKQDELWKVYFQELGLHEATRAIVDNKFTRDVEMAMSQSIKCYLSEPYVISPQQDHQTAIEVKTRFLEDVNSTWNIAYGAMPSGINPVLTRSQYLAYEIQMHTQFLMMQQRQMQLQMEQRQMEQTQLAIAGEKIKPDKGESSSSSANRMSHNKGERSSSSPAQDRQRQGS